MACCPKGRLLQRLRRRAASEVVGAEVQSILRCANVPGPARQLLPLHPGLRFPDDTGPTSNGQFYPRHHRPCRAVDARLQACDLYGLLLLESAQPCDVEVSIDTITILRSTLMLGSTAISTAPSPARQGREARTGEELDLARLFDQIGRRRRLQVPRARRHHAKVIE